jgi:hypothetical protein
MKPAPPVTSSRFANRDSESERRDGANLNAD